MILQNKKKSLLMIYEQWEYVIYACANQIKKTSYNWLDRGGRSIFNKTVECFFVFQASKQRKGFTTHIKIEIILYYLLS